MPGCRSPRRSPCPPAVAARTARRHRRRSPRSRCASRTPSRSTHTPRRPPRTHLPAPPTRRPHHPGHPGPAAPAHRPARARSACSVGKARLAVDLSGARRDQRAREVADLGEHAVDVANSNFCHLLLLFEKRTRGLFATPTGRPRRPSLSEAASRHPLSSNEQEPWPKACQVGSRRCGSTHCARHWTTRPVPCDFFFRDDDVGWDDERLFAMLRGGRAPLAAARRRGDPGSSGTVAGHARCSSGATPTKGASGFTGTAWPTVATNPKGAVLLTRAVRRRTRHRCASVVIRSPRRPPSNRERRSACCSGSSRVEERRERSTPATRPVGPTVRAAGIAEAPAPQHKSSTSWPPTADGLRWRPRTDPRTQAPATGNGRPPRRMCERLSPRAHRRTRRPSVPLGSYPASQCR